MQKIDIDDFLQNPSSFKLFRGENASNQGGVYFCLDENWAKEFGDRLLSGYLPVYAKIKLLTAQDLDSALASGKVLEKDAIEFLFKRSGYDALITTDSRGSHVIDVIINPKHLNLFNDKPEIIKKVNKQSKMDNLKNIFWLEDEEDLVEIYTYATDKKFNVDFFRRVKEAINHIKEIAEGKAEKPDIAIIDLQLPDANGGDVIRELQNTLQTKNVPIFVYTNYRESDGRERYIDGLKVEKYLIKSKCNPTELIRLIKEFLEDK